MTNDKRMKLARKALSAFNGKTCNKMNHLDLDDSITDLITDLLHYADSRGMDIGALQRRVVNHFLEEHKEVTR